jgi:extracellular factor (EF) 3-hydroxypalmitic acid methyl ester biosynthesis protein
LVYEVVGAPIDLDFVEGVVSAEKVLHEQEESLKACQAINEQFKVAVLDVKSWLQSLKVQCEREERAIVMKSPQYQERFRRAFSASVSQHLTKNLPTIHRKLIPFLSGLEPESLSRHTEFFRAHLGEIFHLAPFSHRSFTKPRGYAGDFEMMNQLYRNDFEGESIFAAALHHYFINEPAGQAVRNRREYLKRKIVYSSMKFQKAEGTHIASIACGPAQELVDSMDRLGEIRSNFYFDCIDQDEVSLQGALINLKRKGIPDNVKVSFKNLAIKNIIARGLTEGKYDLVYSAGLFDYFSEPVAKMAAKVLLKSVKPGGQLIIGNFSKSNPTLALMNLAWDWHLIYRSEGELKSLFSDLGAEITIEKEDLGINLFCVLRKIE